MSVDEACKVQPCEFAQIYAELGVLQNMKQAGHLLASHTPDARIRNALVQIQQVGFRAIFCFGAITLAGWIFPLLGRVLPHAFSLMRANTAFLVTLSALSGILSMERRSDNAALVARLIGIFVSCFASLILLKDFGLITLRIETLLAADAASLYPGKVSPEGAFSFLLLGLILAGLRVRKNPLSHLIDFITLTLCLAMLIFLSGYFFGLSHLFVLYQNNPFSVQTLACLLLLTFLVAARRAEYGLFSILLDVAGGGMAARLGVPFAIAVPFLVAIPKAMYVRAVPGRDSEATAIATSLLSIIAVCLVLLLAWRTRAFELKVRELSLRDELTGLYNRRGFYMLAEQAFQLAKRPPDSFSIVYFDLDHLKQVNDSLGHNVGSEMLKEMADHLSQTFRKTDVIGRIGGDEFVVAGITHSSAMKYAIARLEETVAESNKTPGRKYQLSFSLGCIDAGNDLAVTVEELLTRADDLMYQNKRAKRSARKAT